MELDEIIQRSIVTQTLENESRQLKIKKLKDAVSALGFNVVQNVPYDGNCFFHAVGLLCGKDGHLFREETVCFIEQEMLNDSNSFYDESLIRILQAPNEDVQDNRVCKAIADMTGRVVVVLTLFNDERPITPETIYPTNGNKEDPCIYIGHIEDSHFVPIRAKSHKRVRSLSSTDHRQQPKRKQTRMITDFFSKGISSSGQHTPDSGSNISRTELNNTTRTDGTHDTGFNTSRAELNGTTETDGTHDSRFNTPTADLNDTTQTDGTHDSGSNNSGTELNVNDTTETDVQLQQTTIQEPILDDTTPDLNSTHEIAQSLHVPTLTRDEISPYPNDIGSIFRPNMSSMEASSTAMSLNDQQRYNLLTNHFSPSQNYKFKPVFQNGCNRRCSRNFITAYPWLVFSDCQNGVFCIHCALFAKNRSKLNQFVNSPFNNWYKFKEKVEIHAQRLYHRESVLASQAFNDKMTNPSSTLPHIINRELEQRVTTNRHILKHIIKALLFCAKQCIGLRGTIETFHMTPTVNPGNFIAFLRDRAEDDEILREHLLFPQKKNAKYVSPPSQNELISIIANFISEQLIQDILSAKFYTIMADEVTSHNQEFMPLCIRFVDKSRRTTSEKNF